MSLPETIRVRISSETVEMISMTAVVTQMMSLEELVGVILGGVGKDEPRIVEILQRGTFVSGASRFRWERLEVPARDIARLLALYPDPDPMRPFNAGMCKYAMIAGAYANVEVERAAAERKRLFRRRSFWNFILELADGATYHRYSYKDKADVYRAVLDIAGMEKLREGARLSPYSTFSRQIDGASLDRIDFFVKR
jgi:hypothetical protein